MLQCHSECRSGGPESRNLPLSTDLSNDARGDMKDDRLLLGMAALDKKKRNGKGSECVFVSMSVFPFLFFERRRAKAAGLSAALKTT